ncbi:hypothetical protein F5Y18DRAFT_148234 [Xylariaceae sp. FL1019]|nr:hypothetical protein F5Y18DRAFT_148234 [Xylariaceae sp. FL1019]
MWLINARTLELKEFLGDRPPYAVLSHTWDGDELTFKDMSKGRGRDKRGFQKVQLLCGQAIKDHIDWAWIDTCCIDKRSSAELSEAINSMFDWYEKSDVCYTYISDQSITESLLSLFQDCRWRGRGWTLQELLAPSNVVFYDSRWKFLGTKRGLAPVLSDITGINVEFIAMTLPWSNACIAEKMSWAARRTTTRPEDEAYCLLGIFGINMPLLYGEGRFNAFQRLQIEILGKSHYDSTIFGFNIRPEAVHWFPVHPKDILPERQLFSPSLANNVNYFNNAHDIETQPSSEWANIPEVVPIVQPGRLRVTVPIIKLNVLHEQILPQSGVPPAFPEQIFVVLFGIRLKSPSGSTLPYARHTIGLLFYEMASNLYVRVKYHWPTCDAIAFPLFDSNETLKSLVRTIDIQRPIEPSRPGLNSIDLYHITMASFPRLKLRSLVVCPPTKYEPVTQWVEIPGQPFNTALFALIISLEDQDIHRHICVVVRSYSPDRPFAFEAIELDRCEQGVTLLAYQQDNYPEIDIRSVPANKLDDDLKSLRGVKDPVADHQRIETDFFPAVFDLGEDRFYTLDLKITGQGIFSMVAYIKTYINEWERVHWRPMATTD